MSLALRKGRWRVCNKDTKMQMHTKEKRLEFFGKAEETAKASPDPKRRVGCVLVNPKGEIVGTGYNNMPWRVADRAAKLKGPSKNDYMVHAELSALMIAGPKSLGCAAYVTSPPCYHCALHLMAGGVVEVHHIGAHDPNSKWAEDWARAEKLYDDCAVPVFERSKND